MGRARSTGLASIGQVFLGPAAYHANKGTFAGYPGVFFLMGIHPCDGQECTGATLKAMREAFAEDPRLRAVGEIGLDFYWKDCPPFIQEEAFRVQLALAKETDRPVVIHSRDAAKDTLRILEAEGFSGRPVLWRGKPNEPALVAFTAETVAIERGMAPAELWTLCGDNTRRFFNAPAKGL